MREIKFKFWDAKENVMSSSFDWYDLKLMPPGWIDREILQYTGLKDKRGVEIYNGDIIRWRDSRNLQVKWGNVGWILRGDLFKDATHPEIGECTEHNTIGYIWNSEIIGNIYKNPELITN